jgi:hypothetical protein
MIKYCEVCGNPINTKNEPYFKFGNKYICDDTINVECIVNWCGQHRKNEEKTQGY